MPVWNTIWKFLRKLKVELLDGTAVPFLGMYPRNWNQAQRFPWTPMLTAALVTMAQVWKQPVSADG